MCGSIATEIRASVIPAQAGIQWGGCVVHGTGRRHPAPVLTRAGSGGVQPCVPARASLSPWERLGEGTLARDIQRACLSLRQKPESSANEASRPVSTTKSNKTPGGSRQGWLWYRVLRCDCHGFRVEYSAQRHGPSPWRCCWRGGDIPQNFRPAAGVLRRCAPRPSTA